MADTGRHDISQDGIGWDRIAELANFGSRIVAYIICAETETGWHFPVTYNYFYNSATIILSDELIFLISDLLT
jgi:hypothetical protein